MEEEVKDEYLLDFEFKNNIWNKVMIINFMENEDLGKVSPLRFNMQNYIVPEDLDLLLKSIMQIILIVTAASIILLIIKKRFMAFCVLDQIITLCFLIYLNVKLPFNLESFLYFFNIKSYKIVP